MSRINSLLSVQNVIVIHPKVCDILVWTNVVYHIEIAKREEFRVSTQTKHLQGLHVLLLHISSGGLCPKEGKSLRCHICVQNNEPVIEALSFTSLYQG